MQASSSVWSAAKLEASAVTALERDTSSDVCVVGAGVSGLLIAHALACSGRSVVVLDKDGVFCGETSRTTAHLTALIDPGYARVESIHGERKAQILAESHGFAVSEIERLVADFALDCDFRRVDAYLFDDGSDEQGLEADWRAAQRAGIECGLVAGAPLPFAHGKTLHLPHQAELHPLKFGAELLRRIHALGVRVHAPARVVALEKGERIAVRTLKGPIVFSADVVIATNSPINDLVAMHTKQAAYRSYALAVPVPRGTLAPALFWDRATPYHYIRTAAADDLGLAGDSDMLVVGGEDHKVGQELRPELAWTRLEQWVRERFERATAPRFRWSGQVLESADGVAFIGKNPGDERVYIATGQSGNGMTYAAIASRLITDLIDGRENAWAKLFDPARIPLAPPALGSFVRENLNVARRYTDWFGKGDAERIDQIERGQGAVIGRGLKKVAVYVDERGAVHRCSARCPHLNGLVSWNRAEKSWDCPCHGSRFDAYGRVLMGPAVRDLERLERLDDDDARPTQTLPALE